MSKNRWRVLNAEIDLRLHEQPDFLVVPPTSDFCNSVVFNAGEAAVQAFVDELSEYMANPSATTDIQESYRLAQHQPPVITPTQFQYWAHHKLLAAAHDSPTCDLQNGDGLFAFCPANRNLKEYHEVVQAANSAFNQAILGNRRGKLDESVPIIARCHTLEDLRNALLHRGAACGLMCQPRYQKQSQYVFLTESLAHQLNTKSIRDCITADATKERLRVHYLLHECEVILRTFAQLCTNYRLVSAAVKTNLASSMPFKQAVQRIQRLPDYASAICQRDLNPTGLVTLRMEKKSGTDTKLAAPGRRSATQVSLSPLHKIQAPCFKKRKTLRFPHHSYLFFHGVTSMVNAQGPAPSNTSSQSTSGQQRAKSRPTTRDLPADELAAVRSAGFFSKITSRNAESYQQWSEICRSWPLPSVCRLYATIGFSCPHGMSGKLQGSCPKGAHTAWANLGAADKEKVRNWVAANAAIFKLEA